MTEAPCETPRRKAEVRDRENRVVDLREWRSRHGRLSASLEASLIQSDLAQQHLDTQNTLETLVDLLAGRTRCGAAVDTTECRDRAPPEPDPTD